MPHDQHDDAFQHWGGYDQDDPYPLFAEVRTQGGVHAVMLHDGHDAWLVATYDAAKTALNDTRLSKDMGAALATGEAVVDEGLPGPAFARHMLNVDPPDHTRLRKLVSAAFSNRRVEELRPRVQTIVDDLLDDLAGRGPNEPVDLVATFTFPLPFTVICELLGIPAVERATFGRDLTTLLGPTHSAETHARAVAASESVVIYLTGLIQTKQQSPGDDLISALIDARDGDARLNDHELRSTIFQLIVAGHDTTTNLIGNGLVALLRHPEQLAAVRAEPERIPAAIEESLRYDGPVQHATFRYATEPIELEGITIPAGAQVIIGLASANRDHHHYANPDTFDIHRDLERHLGFGHGIHHCLGAGLARMEADLAFRSLLHRFPDIRLTVPVDELHWGHGDGLVLRGLSALPVALGPQQPHTD